jgi:uncharacterized protein (UPF0261 family)
MPFVYLLATLDTKGPDADFVRQRLLELGVKVRLVDVGCLGEPAAVADIDRTTLFHAAGKSHAELVARGDRSTAIQAATQGAVKLITEAHERGKLSGVLALGGSAGTTIGTAAMRVLPLGVPKVMVSTMASGEVRRYVGDKDIFMLNSIVDIAGVNRISRPIFDQAARAMAGLVLHAPVENSRDKPLIAATMFGVTTPCVQAAKQILAEAGYETVVFHATGSGGAAMESLVREGQFVGVLDITTTELADEIVGGFLTAGPTRLTTASEKGIPQVVSVGATDMVNFFEPESVPKRFHGRKFYNHNATTTLMRTTAEENRTIGEWIGKRIAATQSPASVLFPLRGVSAIDAEGKPFDDPHARTACLEGIQSYLTDDKLSLLDLHINDPAFAKAAAEKLLSLLATQKT